MTSGDMEGGNVLWGGEERVRESLIIYFLIFGFFFHRSFLRDVSLRRVNCCQPTSTVSWGAGGSEWFFSCHFYMEQCWGDTAPSASALPGGPTASNRLAVKWLMWQGSSAGGVRVGTGPLKQPQLWRWAPWWSTSAVMRPGYPCLGGWAGVSR